MDLAERHSLAVRRVDRARGAIAARVSSMRSAVARAEDAARAAAKAKERVALYGQARDLLTRVAEAERDAVRGRVERVVGHALRSVFGPHMRFKLEAAVKRGALELQPMVGYAGDGDTCRWVGLDSVGGGVVDVVAFAARLCLLLTARPPRVPVLIADEPFRHVSAQHLPAVAAMVKALCGSLGVQVVIVSHEPELAAAAESVARVRLDQRGRSVVGIASGGAA